MIAVALIFLFTAAMFVIHNILVERRNTLVIRSATENERN
jgi:uncharacterized protein YxeA